MEYCKIAEQYKAIINKTGETEYYPALDIILLSVSSNARQ